MNGDWFEEAWLHRERVVYPDYFRSRSDGAIVTIPRIAFAQMGIEQVDPRWLHCGVLKFPRVTNEGAITFVTSGLSNAWDAVRPDPDSPSGLGFELRIDNLGDEHWVVDILLRLSAMQLLIAAGKFKGVRLIAHGDRVRVSNDTFAGTTEMTSLLAVKDADLRLPSGTFELISLFTITDAERQLAMSEGAESLIDLLKAKTAFPVNDVTRRSVT